MRRKDFPNMNITIRKSDLLNALQNTAHAVSSNSPKPSLRGILIEARLDRLTLTGSDADISIRETIVKSEENKLNIIEEGSILIESRYLLEIVRKIDSEDIQIEVIDGALTRFSGGSAVFRINGMRYDDYPDIDFNKPSISLKMQAGQLSSIIEQTAFAASAKDTRPVLTGVNFKLDQKVLCCTATDSYRLAKKKIEFDSEDYFNVTIPAKSLNEVRSTMLGDLSSEIEIALNDKKAQFISENMIVQTRLLDGGFPETDRLIPKEFISVLKLSRNDLIHAIDRTTFIKNDNMTINRLSMSADECILSNRSQEIGESTETLVAEYTGDPMNISFAGNYVISAARALRGNTVTISFTGDMKPFIMKGDEDDSILQLVLPVRTYN